MAASPGVADPSRRLLSQAPQDEAGVIRGTALSPRPDDLILSAGTTLHVDTSPGVEEKAP
jgi:hypothetical protein